MKKNTMIDLREKHADDLYPIPNTDDLLHLLDGTIIVADETLNKSLLDQAEGMLIVAGYLHIISYEKLSEYTDLIAEVKRKIRDSIKHNISCETYGGINNGRNNINN